MLNNNKTNSKNSSNDCSRHYSYSFSCSQKKQRCPSLTDKGNMFVDEKKMDKNKHVVTDDGIVEMRRETMDEKINGDGSKVIRHQEHCEHVARVTRVETVVVRRKKISHDCEESELPFTSFNTTITPANYDNDADKNDTNHRCSLHHQTNMINHLTVPENTKVFQETDNVVDDDDEDEGMDNAQSSYEGLFVKKIDIKNDGCSSGMDVQWRDPTLNEVIEYLSDPDDSVKINATAYLQHLCFNNDQMKAKTRALGGILSLVLLLRHDNPVVQRNACGALLNLCHSQRNEANKLEVYKVGGIEALSNLIGYSAFDDIRETAAAVLWNMSSSITQQIKMAILTTDCLSVLVRSIIIPYSGWHPEASKRLNPQGIFPCGFKNATGVLRACSSINNSNARYMIRSCQGLVASLLHAIQSALCTRNEINGKCLENCICILRNLSHRLLEEDVVLTNPEKCKTMRSGGTDSRSSTLTETGSSSSHEVNNSDQFCQHILRILPTLIALLKHSGNVWILEAIASLLQNMTCLPSAKHPWCERFRSEIRRAKGVPALIELLRYEKSEKVIAVTAMALRNISNDDERNGSIIADCALGDLILILPAPCCATESDSENTYSHVTLCAVLCTLHELISGNEIVARNAAALGLIEKLLGMLRSPHLYSIKLLSYCAHLLNALWKMRHLHDLYRKMGYTSDDFTSHNKLLLHLINSTNNSQIAAAAAGSARNMGSTSCISASAFPFFSIDTSRTRFGSNRQRSSGSRNWTSTIRQPNSGWNSANQLSDEVFFQPTARAAATTTNPSHKTNNFLSTSNYRSVICDGLVEQMEGSSGREHSTVSSTLPLYATICKRTTSESSAAAVADAGGSSTVEKRFLSNNNPNHDDADSWV